MAWTSPMTFTPNTVLTAAQMNTHLRDNLLELAPAKCTQSGSLFMGKGPNSIAERVIKTSRVDTTESTTVTEYRSLPTSGPKVTVAHDTKVFVMFSAAIGAIEENQASYMSYEMTGANFSEPSDSKSLLVEGVHAQKDQRWLQISLEDELKPGVTTFTCKYKSGTDKMASTFHDRFIAVWPF